MNCFCPFDVNKNPCSPDCSLAMHEGPARSWTCAFKNVAVGIKVASWDLKKEREALAEENEKLKTQIAKLKAEAAGR